MNNNILNTWKNECYLLSSPIAIKRTLKRADVDLVHKVLADYFGIEFFEVKASGNSKLSWLHFLLANHSRPACIAALFEVVNLINYLNNLTPSVQKKFKTLFADPRQFRDMFFEVYVRRLLEYNGIPCEKNPKEGAKQLDIVCTLAGKMFLGECRKLYAPNINLLHTEKYLIEKVYFALQSMNKGFGLIGVMKFSNINDEKIKEIFESKLLAFIKGFNEQSFCSIDYHDIDENGEFSVFDYSKENNIELEDKIYQYHLMFKIIPPFNSIADSKNTYRVQIKSNFGISQQKTLSKLFNTIKDKSQQHIASSYVNKIYFLDSEAIPDFDMPIFRLDPMFEEDKIREYVETFSQNEVFCFIRREYIDDVPRTSIKAFGRNIDRDLKQRLENLRTNFDYSVAVG